MNIDWIRDYCLSLPHTTERIQWEDDLVFKVGGKMFAVVALEPARAWLSFKCSAEEFADLVEQPGIIPAPYLARAKWVALTLDCMLPPGEIKRLVRKAHDLVFENLPRKAQKTLSSRGAAKEKPRSKKT